MTYRENKQRNGSILLVILMITALLSGCSQSAEVQIKPKELTQGELTGSTSLSVELPKKKSGALEPANAKAAAELNQVIEPVDPLLTQEPGAAPADIDVGSQQDPASTELAPLVAALSQPASPPVIDLSIPEQARIGFRAPDFSLQTIDGQTLRLADLLGRPLVINYWATWCVPCIQEIPILEKLHREYQQQGVVFVSVNAIDQDKLDKVQATVNEFSMSFPVLLDQNRVFADTYQAIFFPTTFVVDVNGVIRQISLGDNTEAELRTMLDSVLTGS